VALKLPTRNAENVDEARLIDIDKAWVGDQRFDSPKGGFEQGVSYSAMRV
jgi:hypothetical protein